MGWRRPQREFSGRRRVRQTQKAYELSREALQKWWEEVKDLPAPRLQDPLHHTSLDTNSLFKRGKRCLPQA